MRSRISILLSLLVVLATGCLNIPHASAAYTASDEIGQLKENDQPLFTMAGRDNAPSTRAFAFPLGVALDTVHHHLFVTDPAHHRVLIFNLDSTNHLIDHEADYVIGQSDMAGIASAHTNSTLNQPVNVDIDTTNNRLFVPDSLNNRVLVYDLSGGITDGMSASYVLGQFDFVANTASTTSTGMNFPAGVSWDDTNKRLWVVDYNNNRALMYNLSAGITNGMSASNVLGQSTFTTGVASTTARGMYNPHALLADPIHNRLFISDITNNRTLIFDTTSLSNGQNASYVLGQATFTSSTTATTAGGMNGPVGIVLDSARNRLLIADHYNNRVLMYDTSSGFSNGMSASHVLGQSNFITSIATSTQSGFNGSESLAYDPTNQFLYAPDQLNHRLMIFDLSGGVVDGMNASDLLGHVDEREQPVYTANNQTDAPNAQGFAFPQGSALDAINHRLFVADLSNNRVLVFNLDTSGNFIDHTADYILGQPNSYTNTASSTSARMNQPIDACLNTAGTQLYVPELGNNRVLIFDSTPGTLATGASAVHVLGQSNFTARAAATTQSGMSVPTGCAVDSVHNRLFVTDNSNNRVLVYDTASISDGMNASNVLGQSSFTVAIASTTATGVSAPYRPFYDATNNRLFVPDFSNNRIMVWDVSSITNGKAASNVLGQADFVHGSVATTQAGLSGPDGAAFDPETGRLFVADYSNNRILLYDISSGITNGQTALAVLAQNDYVSAANAASQSGLSNPTGLSYDQTNKILYVTDNQHHRVMKFVFAKITAGALTSGTIGASYSQSLPAVNTQGTVSYAVVGSLPDGLSFSNGTLSGTPTSATSSSFTIQATDTNGAIGNFISNPAAFTLVIVAPSSSGGKHFRSPVPVMASESTSTPIVSVPASVLPSTGANTAAYSFPRNLTRSMTGQDVQRLQQYLNAHTFIVAQNGPGSPGKETFTFGLLTYAALVKFQEAHRAEILTPLGLTRGTGYFGPSTRAIVNKTQ